MGIITKTEYQKERNKKENSKNKKYFSNRQILLVILMTLISLYSLFLFKESFSLTFSVCFCWFYSTSFVLKKMNEPTLN